MGDWDILAVVAERKIRQALEEGWGKNLAHWKNRPLPPDDMQGVPPELRMAYRVLKNSGFVPEEVALQKEIASLEEMLATCDDERLKVKQLKKLEYLKFKLDCRLKRPLRLDEESPYYEKVVDRLQVRSEADRRSGPTGKETDGSG